MRGLMMSKLYLSFLGSSNYKAIHYEFTKNNSQQITKKKFKYVQEAYFSKFKDEWNEDDRIIFLLTEEAEKKNWEDYTFERKNNCQLIKEANEGLANRLKKLKLKPDISIKRIETGKTEKELWVNFLTIYSVINSNDKIVFDITHGFRSLSMSLLTILNYAKVLKNIELQAIYYGAYEAKYTSEKNEEVEPVFDLSSFETLLDWSIASDSLIKYGQVKDFERLTEKKLKDRYISGKKGEKTKSLADLKVQLNKVINPIRTSQCESILFKSDYTLLRELIEQNKQTFLPPIIPLLELIQTKFKAFSNNSFKNGFISVDWCLQHGLIQQGYTILIETIISYILCSVDKVDLTFIHDYKDILIDKDERLNIPNAIRIWQREEKLSEEEKGYENNQQKERTEKIISFLEENFSLDFARDFQKLSECRNNINHCGFKKKCSNKKFECELRELNKNFKRWLNV